MPPRSSGQWRKRSGVDRSSRDHAGLLAPNAKLRPRLARERNLALSGVDAPPPAVYVAGHRSTVLEFGFPASRDGVRLTVATPCPN